MTPSGWSTRRCCKTSWRGGNNGLIKTKYLTFSIEADSIRSAKPRLERIETDVLNNFKRLGVAAEVLDGKARLAQLHAIFHMDEQAPFQFEWDWLAPAVFPPKTLLRRPALSSAPASSSAWERSTGPSASCRFWPRN